MVYTVFISLCHTDTFLESVHSYFLSIFCLYIIYGIVKEQAGHMIPSEYETQSSYKAPGVSSETPFLKKQTYAHTKHPLVPLKQVHSEQLCITLTMK